MTQAPPSHPDAPPRLLVVGAVIPTGRRPRGATDVRCDDRLCGSVHVSGLRWAPPGRADNGDWAGLLAAIEAVDRFGQTYGPDDVEDEWASVWAHPETDSMFVWDGSDLVAFGWIKTQIGAMKGHRIQLWGGVHPARRREGIGTAVLRWQLGQARAIAGKLDASVPTSTRVTAFDGQDDLFAIAGHLGFEPIRRFLKLARPTADPLPTIEPVPGLCLVPWHDDLDAATRVAHGEAFLDHWGSEPRSEAEWRQGYTGHRGFRPDLSAVAVDHAGEVAAFVLTAAYPLDWETGVAPVEAWINTVGTRPSWRKRGVGRWVLAHVLEQVANSKTGFERAMLGVDAENPTGALVLYRSLGFEEVRAITTLAASSNSDGYIAAGGL